jgi:hypothetical protein
VTSDAMRPIIERVVPWHAAARIALGGSLALAPAAARAWVGPVADDADARGPLRVLGVRDGLLGAAVLLTKAESSHRRRMIGLCAVADIADTIVSAADWRRTRRLGAAGAAATAAASAIFGFWAAR